MDRPAVITSKSNRLIIRIGSLAEKKYRDSERLFRFDGIKLFREAAACGIALRCVLVSADAAGERRRAAMDADFLHQEQQADDDMQMG